MALGSVRVRPTSADRYLPDPYADHRSARWGAECSTAESAHRTGRGWSAGVGYGPGTRVTRNRADVPGSREAVTTDSVGLGPSPAPSPPSGHRRRRGHLGPEQPAASGMSGVTAGFLRTVVAARVTPGRRRSRRP